MVSGALMVAPSARIIFATKGISNIIGKGVTQTIPTWAGSGPASGILGVNASSTSTGVLKNFFPKVSVEYIFDPKTATFLVRGSKAPYLHQGLAKSIAADESVVVGGMLTRSRETGAFITDELSGHFWEKLDS